MPAPVRRKFLLLAAALLLALVAASAAGATPAGLGLPDPQSPNAQGIQDLYWVLLAVTGIIFVLVEGALLLFVLRFRSRGRGREVEGPQIRGHTRLELLWTAVPVVILAGIASFVFYELPGINDVPPAGAAGGRLNVKIEGHQFYWEFKYPNGVVQVNRMRVPAGRPVTLDISSADVDHSWWVPSLGGKFDAIPGRTNHTWFKALRPGVYHGQCGEFCGIQHAAMLASVEAMPAAAFDSWLASETKAQKAGTSDLGSMTFHGACATCHGDNGQGLIGPSLNQNPITADAKALATVIRNGRNKMPAVGKTWDRQQLDATIAYLKMRFAPKGATSGG
jgi:cytochrome c oxidase subunit 2